MDVTYRHTGREVLVIVFVFLLHGMLKRSKALQRSPHVSFYLHMQITKKLISINFVINWNLLVIFSCIAISATVVQGMNFTNSIKMQLARILFTSWSNFLNFQLQVFIWKILMGGAYQSSRHGVILNLCFKTSWMENFYTSGVKMCSYISAGLIGIKSTY